MQLCNKYLLKTKRKVISLDKSRIQQLLNFFSLLTRASTQLEREFGVIFPHYFSSSSAGDRAPLEYPIWLLLQYAKMNCLWRKITPLLNMQGFFFLFFFYSRFDFTWVKVSSCARIPARTHAEEHHFIFLSFLLFPPPLVVIECSFISLFILYIWDRNENTHWCKLWCSINSTSCCFNIHF